MTSPTTLIRWSGAAAIAGALLLVQAPLLHPSDTPEGLQSATWVPSHFAVYVGNILLQLALVGILVRQLRRAGRLGVVGFVIAFFGLGLTLMEGRDHIFSLPLMRLNGLQTSDPDQLHGLWELILNSSMFSIGHILLGIAILRARVLPPAPAVIMAVGAPILAFSPPIGLQAALIGTALYSSAMVWLGYAQMTLSERTAPARVSYDRLGVPQPFASTRPG